MKFPEIDKAHFPAAEAQKTGEAQGQVSAREAAKDALIENLTKQVEQQGVELEELYEQRRQAGDMIENLQQQLAQVSGNTD